MNVVGISLILAAVFEAPSALVEAKDAGVVGFFDEEDHKIVALRLFRSIRHDDFLHVNGIEGATAGFLSKIMVSLDA